MVDELIRKSDVIDAIHSRNKALLRDEPYRRKRGDIYLLGVIDNINAIPTIEVEPVKHGHWIKVDKHTVKCSECGNYLDMCGVNAGRGDANYCPNCGAKMDEAERRKIW